MTKKNFETVEVEVLRFDDEDIVCASGTQSGDYIEGEEDWG